MRNLKFLTILFFVAISSGALSQETPRDYDNEALSRIKRIHRLLEQQTQLPFDKTLDMEMSKLYDIEPNIEDRDIQKKIEQIYDEYDDKTKELKAQAATQAAAQAAAKAQQEKAQKVQDSIKQAEADAKQEKIREEEKKRQNRLIILGVIAAVVMFISNQVIQTVRNKKTQRNIEQMQRNATTQVENRAKRKVAGEIRREVSQTTSQVRQKGKEAIRNATKRSGIKKGKNISI